MLDRLAVRHRHSEEPEALPDAEPHGGGCADDRVAVADGVMQRWSRAL